MRHTVHDGRARFRISDNLREEAQRRAARDGMSLSELIRSALRRELRDAA